MGRLRGRLRGPPSRSSRISAIEAATSGTRAVIDDATQGLSSIRTDIARLHEPRRERAPHTPAPAGPALRPVRPMSRLVPRGGVFVSWRMLAILLLLGAGTLWATGSLPLAPVAPTRRPVATPVREETPDWSAAWRPGQPAPAASPIVTGTIQAAPAAEKPAAASLAQSQPAPRRTYHSRETPQHGRVARRVLATRSVEPAAAAAPSRAWTGTFYAK